MRAAKITLVILIVLGLMIWIRGGTDLGHIARIIPFCGGFEPSLYDAAAILLIILAVLGLRRLKQTDDPEDA